MPAFVCRFDLHNTKDNPDYKKLSTASTKFSTTCASWYSWLIFRYPKKFQTLKPYFFIALKNDFNLHNFPLHLTEKGI